MKPFVCLLSFSLAVFASRGALAQSYPLYCRGGGNGTGTVGSAASTRGPNCELESFYYRTISPGTDGEQYSFTTPEPGECRWKDRPFNGGDPTLLYNDYNVNNCSQTVGAAAAFTITNGTTVLYLLDQYGWGQEQTWVWPMTWDQSQFFTLSVHSTGGLLMVDQLLCSGYCM